MGQAGYTQFLVIEDVTLGTCKAHRYDVSSSHCDYCYTGLEAKVNYNGTDTYYTRFDSIESNVQDTSVITLLADVPRNAGGSFWFITETLTLDLNGHTFAGKIGVGDTVDLEYSGYFTLQNTSAAAGTFTGKLCATLGTLTVTGGQVSTLEYADECAVTLSGGSFGSIKRAYYGVSHTPANLLKASFAYRSTEGDKALVELDGVSSTLNNVEVVTCPHGRANGTYLCAYCHAEAVAAVIHADTATEYFALTDAVRAAKAGDTVTLIKGCDSLTIESGAAFTLDLNGKTISDLRVKITPIFLADSAGGGTITTLSLDGVTAGQLLNAGWGLSTAQGGANTWHDKTSTATSLSGAKVAKLPIQSVSLQATARDSDIPQTSYAFCDYHVLTATATQPEGKSETVSYAWYRFVGETESSVSTNYSTFAPNTPMVGTYLYRVKVTVDGYQTSADLSIEVTKATIPAGSYTHVNENYNDVTSLPLTVTVSEKEYKLLTVTMNGWTYGQTAKAPVFTIPNGTTATILYSHGGALPTQTVPTNAGSYTVTVRYETATEIWTGQAAFTIAQGKLNTPTFDRVSEAGKTLAEVDWDVDAFATLT